MSYIKLVQNSLIQNKHQTPLSTLLLIHCKNKNTTVCKSNLFYDFFFVIFISLGFLCFLYIFWEITIFVCTDGVTCGVGVEVFFCWKVVLFLLVVVVCVVVVAMLCEVGVYTFVEIYVFYAVCCCCCCWWGKLLLFACFADCGCFSYNFMVLYLFFFVLLCCSYDIFCAFLYNIVWIPTFYMLRHLRISIHIYMRNLSKIISLCVTSPSYILNNTTSSPGEALVVGFYSIVGCIYNKWAKVYVHLKDDKKIREKEKSW